MGNPSLIFSNPDYYLNETFVKLLREWNRYLQSDEQNEDVLAQWEELILKDFRTEANKWRKENKQKTKWRKDLR